MIIAIPSHKRAKLLQEKTLRLLPKGVAIHVYTSSYQESMEYQQSLGEQEHQITYPADDGHSTFASLIEKLNAIPLRYREGEELVIIEDDISSIEQKGGFGMEQKTVPLDPGQVLALFQRGFKECRAAKAMLWGINPVCNGFYMADSTSANLKLCVGFMFGLIVSHDPFLRLRASHKTDYERTALHYVRDGSVVRLNNIACKTTCYTVPGGLQAESGRKEKEQTSVDYLLRRFPHFLQLNEKRKDTSPYPELSFKRADAKTDWKKIQKVADWKAKIK